MDRIKGEESPMPAGHDAGAKTTNGSSVIPLAVGVEEAAKMIGLSARTVRTLILDGELPHCRPTPGRVVVMVDDLQVFLRSRRIGGCDE